MDDWVVLAPTRWKLRRAIRVVNRVLAELRAEKHPDKTSIGPISRGFDFLGYQFFPGGLGIAQKSLDRFVERITRLQEQDASLRRIGDYVRRWWSWVKGGVSRELSLGSGEFCGSEVLGFLGDLGAIGHIHRLW